MDSFPSSSEVTSSNLLPIVLLRSGVHGASDASAGEAGSYLEAGSPTSWKRPRRAYGGSGFNFSLNGARLPIRALTSPRPGDVGILATCVLLNGQR